MDPEIIKKLENTIDIYQNKELQIKRVTMRVKPQLLYRVNIKLFNLICYRQKSYSHKTNTAELALSEGTGLLYRMLSSCEL